MEHRPFRAIRANKRVLLALIAVLLVATLVAVVPGIIGHGVRSASAVTKDQPGGLGQLTGLLPRDHLTEESAIQVDLSNETVRLPLYKGEAYGKTAWFVLLDASDAGLAHDLGVNYAPKLANIGIGCPACVQTVTIDNPTPAQNPFGPALVHFQGAPAFSPTRIAVPGPNGFPLAKFQPGAVAGPVVCQGLRRRPADCVPQHRCRPAPDCGAGAFDLRACAGQSGVQRRRRLPGVRPRAALRLRQR